jgi:prepilin-type processing-associated H-X9-DG protein
MCSEYPPNPQRYLGVATDNNYLFADVMPYWASSMHPRRDNCAFADGSVNLLKDSINAWPNTAANGFGRPPNL